jgi:hypothetical protein
MRRLLLGGAMSVMVCGAVAAKPPGGPLSEGRELDPVARDYYQGEPPTPPAGNADPARGAPKPGDSCAFPLLAPVLDMVLRWVTLPLGPFRTNGM